MKSICGRGARLLLATNYYPNRNPKNNCFCSCRSSSQYNLHHTTRYSSSYSLIQKESGFVQNNKHCFAAAGACTRVLMSSSDESPRVFHFELSPSTSLKIQKGDITTWSVNGSSDAIVNAANERMLGGGGVDGAIHRAAGPELRSACYDVPQVQPGVRCPKGEARITPAFKLPVSHVIHTVGPIYDEDDHPEVILKNAYRNCLKLCKENNIQYVAFPAISCGVYRYPYDEAATIALSTIKEFADDLKEVHFVLFLDDIFETWLEKANELL